MRSHAVCKHSDFEKTRAVRNDVDTGVGVSRSSFRSAFTLHQAHEVSQWGKVSSHYACSGFTEFRATYTTTQLCCRSECRGLFSKMQFCAQLKACGALFSCYFLNNIIDFDTNLNLFPRSNRIIIMLLFISHCISSSLFFLKAKKRAPFG